ncbi:PREDICTED: uncharacterized protein LOC105149098 [Acromyrmex echinatior]|uniref:uncharacterized protein LOC105149098 n=1 Tax=Acromyrmex echinatior TaxID=103372 RepID=UPI000580BF2E|nr:PREDICTED: uncharacterized protein LOC105149098 [Acromyrmex echinatior]
MTCAKDRYFSLNRILMLAIGLWPYEQSKLIRLQLTLHYGILGSFIVFQVKHLLELLQDTYDELRDEDEIAIMEKYWNIAKRYTEILTLLYIFIDILFIFSPFLPHIIGTMFSVNESQLQPSLKIVTEYFIDQERYFYLIILHADVAFFIGSLAMLATGTMFLTYMQHVCGMLKIASYRIEQAMTIGIRRMNGIKNANLICKGIIYAIDIHRKALKYSIIKSIFREISSGYISEKVIQCFIILNIHYVYTFLSTNIAQQIIDHNNSIFVTVYNGYWYVVPLHVQKLILFLLQRGTKTFKIMIGGLFVGSLEGFATLVSASFSYFTFIYYTNQ